MSAIAQVTLMSGVVAPYSLTTRDLDSEPVLDNPFLDEDSVLALDTDLIAEQSVRRMLNIGTWLTAMDRRFPLRVSFPTDGIA